MPSRSSKKDKRRAPITVEPADSGQDSSSDWMDDNQSQASSASSSAQSEAGPSRKPEKDMATSGQKKASGKKGNAKESKVDNRESANSPELPRAQHTGYNPYPYPSPPAPPFNYPVPPPYGGYMNHGGHLVPFGHHQSYFHREALAPGVPPAQPYHMPPGGFPAMPYPPNMPSAAQEPNAPPPNQRYSGPPTMPSAAPYGPQPASNAPPRRPQYPPQGYPSYYGRPGAPYFPAPGMSMYDMVPYGQYYDHMHQYYMAPPPPPPSEPPARPATPAPPPFPKEDPEKMRLEAEIAALMAAEAKSKAAEKQKEIETQIRRDTEEAIHRRMEAMKMAQEEAKREIEKAKVEAEHAARARIEAERKAEVERGRRQAEVMKEAEERARDRFEIELKAAEEARKKVAETRLRAEAEAKAKYEAEIRAAEARGKTQAEERARIENEARRKFEAELQASEERRKKETEASAQAQAFLDAKLKLEAETKAAEAQRKAVADARAQGEEDARLKFELLVKEAEEKKNMEAELRARLVQEIRMELQAEFEAVDLRRRNVQGEETNEVDPETGLKLGSEASSEASLTVKDEAERLIAQMEVVLKALKKAARTNIEEAPRDTADGTSVSDSDTSVSASLASGHWKPHQRQRMERRDRRVLRLIREEIIDPIVSVLSGPLRGQLIDSLPVREPAVLEQFPTLSSGENVLDVVPFQEYIPEPESDDDETVTRFEQFYQPPTVDQESDFEESLRSASLVTPVKEVEERKEEEDAIQDEVTKSAEPKTPATGGSAPEIEAEIVDGSSSTAHHDANGEMEKAIDEKESPTQVTSETDETVSENPYPEVLKGLSEETGSGPRVPPTTLGDKLPIPEENSAGTETLESASLKVQKRGRSLGPPSQDEAKFPQSNRRSSRSLEPVIQQ
ncbi:hypothetical protein EDB81DRAFT_942922 [Dactylonectria macrodidyma]|uniref:Uncharacterized protein n=1 Tax=Dactylonectria macrodidyma TaxID=307937 RepID=A0A9P9FN01_9HYPO|nr:hypothetical protein EDB81DRAFT_942922 [Dactylonectria macrodidyma]